VARGQQSGPPQAYLHFSAGCHLGESQGCSVGSGKSLAAPATATLALRGLGVCGAAQPTLAQVTNYSPNELGAYRIIFFGSSSSLLYPPDIVVALVAVMAAFDVMAVFDVSCVFCTHTHTRSNTTSTDRIPS